jgi:peptide/nickel transport system ATP-binding protein
MDPSSGTHRILEVANLTVSVSRNGGTSELIHDVSFSVRANEVLVLLGESGSGKTILGRSLTRLFPATSAVRIDGSVTFEGQELMTLDERGLSAIRRRKIRYVFQEPMQALNPVTRIGQQMRLASDHPSNDDAILHDTLQLVGLADSQHVLDRYPHELSIGMAQRVSIAMAVLSSPALLIADEPTSAVDASLRRRILELLISIQRSRPMSLVLITHDLDVARNYGDRIVVLYSGKIIESSGWKAFFERPLHPYSRLLVNAQPTGQKLAASPELTAVPAVVDVPPHGCSFQPRCPSAQHKCKEVEPELEQLSGEREVRCFYWK